MRRSVTILSAAMLLSCSSGEESSSDSGIYAPCNGEPGACALSLGVGAAEVEFCVCTHYCKVDADCPMPATGSAVPTCVPFGDVVVDGHTASCSLPCDKTVTCPDGMECQFDQCLARID